MCVYVSQHCVCASVLHLYSTCMRASVHAQCLCVHSVCACQSEMWYYMHSCVHCSHRYSCTIIVHILTSKATPCMHTRVHIWHNKEYRIIQFSQSCLIKVVPDFLTLSCILPWTRNDNTIVMETTHSIPTEFVLLTIPITAEPVSLQQWLLETWRKANFLPFSSRFMKICLNLKPSKKSNHPHLQS